MSAAIQIKTALLPVAHMFDDHHDWGDGWSALMVVGMVAFWAVVIVGGVWLVRELGSRRHSSGDAGGVTALEILDRRLAEGEISVEEYAERRRALLDAEGSDRD